MWAGDILETRMSCQMWDLLNFQQGKNNIYIYVWVGYLYEILNDTI